MTSRRDTWAHTPRIARSLHAIAAWAAVARGHPRHLLLAALTAGLALGPWAPAAVIAAAVVAALVTGGRMALALASVAAVLAGALAADLRVTALEAGRLASLKGRDVAGHAVLLEPVRRRSSHLAVVRARLLDGPAAGEQAVLRTRRPSLAGPLPGVGEEVAIAGRVSPLGPWDAYQGRRGAHAALDLERFAPTGRRRGGVAGALDSLRRRAEAGLERGLSPPGAALLRGMVLGEDERLSDDVREDFQRSGLAHVLAVSGQNVMLLAALVLAAGAVVGIRLRARLLTALALVAIYVPLAGGGPSIQRAGVMGAAGLVAALGGRPGQRWYALTLAAAATLMLNPRVEGEPGWQLSFAAVVALLALGRPLRELLARRLPAAVADAAAVTLAATLGTAPLMALHFERLSLVSLPANLVAAPAVAPVMWLGMLAAAVAQAGPALAVPLNALAAPLLAYVSWVAHVSARAPLAVVPLQLPSPLAAVGAYALIGAVVAVVVRRSRDRRPPFRRRWRPGPRLAAVVGAAAALAVVAVVAGRGATAHGAAVRPGELVVSFLDVGQGDATLVQRDGAAILIDTGPPDGPILTRLGAAGVQRLDALVLTHAQADHEGAAIAVLRAKPTRLVVDGGAGWRSPVQRVLPAAAAADGARAIVPQAGETVAVGGMRLRILWPPPPAPGWRPIGDPNQRAVVALLEVGRFRLLLTADAESDVTGALDLPAVDVLKVAHHGSADPGLPSLLGRLHPRLAVIEVGRHNPYGHPAPATLAALRAVPEVLRTDRDGTVRVRVEGDSMRIEHTGRRA